MVSHERALHTDYFIPCHRKYFGQQYQCHIHALHDGKDVVPSNIQGLSCILIGCIFYDMTLKKTAGANYKS